MRYAKSKKEISLQGEVKRIFYESPNFCAGRFLTTEGNFVSFSGNITPKENVPIVLHGNYINHPKYGWQFEARSMEFNQKLDVHGLANYLANDPDIKGIGPVKARTIAELFSDNFDYHLTREPQLIADAVKVPIETIESLCEHWLETKHTNQVMVALSAYELTHYQVTQLVEKYGNNTIGIIERDPYAIIGKIDGFGFKRIDKIARQVGVAKNDAGRIRAGLKFCVEDALGQGDCWVEYENLIRQANDLLVMDSLDSKKWIEEHLDDLIEEGILTCYSTDNQFLVAGPTIREMEESLASIFAGGRNENPCMFDDSYSPGPLLNARQCQAVDMAMSYSISLISGGAGSGKTFTISAIVDIYEAAGRSVMLCAPTGKAAKRMEAATGREAFTIHRLLKYNGKTFGRDVNDPIAASVLIVDECSMVDVPLAWHLFQAINLDRTAVVLVGDHNQLPPVGPGNILRDLIESKVLPTTILDEIMRQAGPLKENSMAILQGKVVKPPGAIYCEQGAWIVIDKMTKADDVQALVLELFENTLSEKLGLDILKDVQLLTPTHKGPLGALELNHRLQRLIQQKLWHFDVPPMPLDKRPKFYLNDKVIQTYNDYDHGIMNGAMGIIREIESDKSLIVEFEDKTINFGAGSLNYNDLQLAYALTIHKSQGSEFPCSIVLTHKSHSFMHHRNLLYTGVTRATKTAIIIGDRWGIANCVDRVQVDARKTFLSLLLPELANTLPEVAL